MNSVDIQLTKSIAKGCVVQLGPVNLVFAYTQTGLIGCGAFDVMELDKFSSPAAKVRSSASGPIETIEDLLEGVVTQANESAKRLGIEPGINAKTALEKF